MKKITQAATTGGAPIYLDDFKDVFNLELWDVLQGMLSVFDTDTEGIIVQGCNIGGSGPSNYSISGGIVYIDGEFRRLTAATGLSLPQYIKAATDVNTTRTFEDTIIKTLFITKSADLDTSIPGSGQYIAITTTTDPDDRRYVSEINGEWVEITNFSTGWSGTCYYRIEKSGRVNLRGTVHATSPSATSTVFPDGTLPNPLNTSRFAIGKSVSAGENVAVFEINTSGGATIAHDFVTDADYYVDAVSYFES